MVVLNQVVSTLNNISDARFDIPAASDPVTLDTVVSKLKTKTVTNLLHACTNDLNIRQFEDGVSSNDLIPSKISSSNDNSLASNLHLVTEKAKIALQNLLKNSFKLAVDSGNMNAINILMHQESFPKEAIYEHKDTLIDLACKNNSPFLILFVLQGATVKSRLELSQSQLNPREINQVQRKVRETLRPVLTNIINKAAEFDADHVLFAAINTGIDFSMMYIGQDMEAVPKKVDMQISFTQLDYDEAMRIAEQNKSTKCIKLLESIKDTGSFDDL